MKWTPCLAIVVIGILEVVAMFKGIDGALFGLAITAVAGLGGYQIKSYLDRRREGK